MLTPIENTEEYLAFVGRYMAQVGAAVLNLPEEKRNLCFKMINDYSDILYAIFPGMSIFENLTGNNPTLTETEFNAKFKEWKGNN
jgi:hypothetical protein